MAFPSQHRAPQVRSQQGQGPIVHYRRTTRSGRRIAVRFVLDDGESTGESAAESAADPTIGQEAFTLNVGVGGAFVATPDPAPPGSRIVLMLDLPSGRTVSVRAEVRWINDGDDDDEHGMGVRFVGLREDELHALHADFAAI